MTFSGCLYFENKKLIILISTHDVKYDRDVCGLISTNIVTNNNATSLTAYILGSFV